MLWSFGTRIPYDEHRIFSKWWKEAWSEFITFPEDLEVTLIIYTTKIFYIFTGNFKVWNCRYDSYQVQLSCNEFHNLE